MSLLSSGEFMVNIFSSLRKCSISSWLRQVSIDITYTMMLLIGMWISLTKNPMNPIIANPIAVAMAIFWNSETTDAQNTDHKIT